ncbi:ABC transporter permease subunit [Cytobacillus suaedae]|nr:ABC transporter permease subunit [Cytobacillus suaedae]
MKGTKGLWMKEYKQSKFLLWAFWLVSLYIPIKLFGEIQNYERHLRHLQEDGPKETYFHYYFNYIDVSLILTLIVLILACTMIGLERTNQSMDFTLSLPFKRQTIMLTKWYLGVVHIVSAILVSITITTLLLSNSGLTEYVGIDIFWYFGLVNILVLVGIFTFTMAIGFLGASVISQSVFSVIFLLFPAGIMVLVNEFLSYHSEALRIGHFYLGHDVYTFFENLSFPLQLILIEQRINGAVHGNSYGPNELTFLPLLIPIIVTIVALGLVLLLSKNMKSESNGKIVVNEKFIPILKIGVFVCFYMLGGAILPSFVHSYNEVPNVITYHIGGLILALIVSFIVSKLLGSRFLLGRRS